MTDLDSRARKPTGVRSFARHPVAGLLEGERVYCTSCGHESKGSRVTVVERAAGPLIYLCATKAGDCGCNCEGRFGRPPEMLTKVRD